MAMHMQHENMFQAIPDDSIDNVMDNSLLVPESKKATKEKPKKLTKRIKRYDEHGNLIGEKTIKVDEFGNPIKKNKKKSKIKRRSQSGESLPLTSPSQSTGNIFERGDSMSSMGVMSAAEVFQRQFRPPPLHCWDEHPRPQQTSTQRQYGRPQQPQMPHPHLQQDFANFNESFTESKPSASSGSRRSGPNSEGDFAIRPKHAWSSYDAPQTNSHGQTETSIQSAVASGSMQTKSVQSKSAHSKSMQSQSHSQSQSRYEMHHLIVQYMISAGADPDVAEDLATRFEEQQQRGIDNYAQSAARVPNNAKGKMSHDIDKFAMFDEENDEGSVASAFIRALEQGAARAQREGNDQMRAVSTPATFSSRVPSSSRVPRDVARTQIMPIPPMSPEEGGAAMRPLLIQYLISMGSDPQVAETMADRFEEQQQQQQQQQVDSDQGVQREPTTASGVVGSNSVVSAEQHEAIQSFHNKSVEEIKDGKRRVQNATMNGATATPAGTRGNPRRGRMLWSHADHPGAVEMEGRAFGAPRRAERAPTDNNERSNQFNQDVNRDIEQLDVDVDLTTGHNYIEAVPVSDKELDIVYAESATFGIKYLLRERPVRRLLALMCILIITATVGATVFTVHRSSGSHVQGDTIAMIAPTVSPTVAPSFITNDIEQAAIAISGAASVLLPHSPQRRAVGWLSSVDEFDTQGLGLLFSERYILTVFYYATHGEMWLEQERWLSPTLHICDWSIGITCGTDLTRKQVVNGIDLTRNGLNGQIPGEIGLIEGLTLLRLAKNSINGTIPDKLCEALNLVTLDLSENQLSGPIPSRIGNLQDLLFLQLFDNLLSGPIPHSTFDLELLKGLDLSKNKLTGQVSTNVTKLLSLGTLNLKNNLFNGSIPSFRNLTALDFIWLDHNQFSGTPPNVGSEMVGRQEFTVSHNRIAGTIPGVESANLADFVDIVIKLQRADISYNQLTGTLPPLIALIHTFRYFDLSGNSFHGPLPAQASVNGWQSLEYFGAAGNQFTGTLALGFTTALSSLDVSNNVLTGSIPLDLYSKFPNLQFVALNGNNLGGNISEQVGSLRKLRGLQLHNCSLTGTIPDDLLGLTSLEYISLHGNELGGVIPSSIGSLTVLKTLDIQNNQLTGGLPSEVGMLNLLTQLNVANNKLTGTLPSSLGSLSKLEGFDVSGNFFLGDVPLGICDNIQNLTRVMVGCNLQCSCCQDSGTTECDHVSN